jgi:signal transduction histidine kinase
MITQHHLRTPVTSIRWELESMLNGTYGRVGAMLKQALNDTNTSVARLTRIVDDFLNITALKVGSQILNIEPGNLEPLVLDVLHELKIDIENMKLSVDCPKDRASWPDLEIDAGKMREVLLIILENAVKYNVDHGTIQIKTRLLEDPASRMFEMSIENTGIGLVSEDREKLFSRHFFRSKRAQAANPIGMGIGLSVARAVVRAHHGDLAIESAGENMGAKVMLKLPL